MRLMRHRRCEFKAIVLRNVDCFECIAFNGTTNTFSFFFYIVLFLNSAASTPQKHSIYFFILYSLPLYFILSLLFVESSLMRASGCRAHLFISILFQRLIFILVSSALFSAASVVSWQPGGREGGIITLYVNDLQSFFIGQLAVY